MAPLISTIASACLLAVTVPPAATADDGAGNWGQFVSNRTAMLEELAAPVEHCFAQNDPLDSGSAMFDGCYDWHSAVHAAYSLHVLYRETGDARYLETFESKNSPDQVAAELEYMRTDIAQRENPYGFSWMLALAKEREQVTGSKDLRPLADEAATRVRESIESLPPEVAQQLVLLPNYPNVSWALIHLQLWGEHTGDAELLGFVQERAQEILLDPELDALCPVEGDTAGDYPEFLPPCLLRLSAVAQIWDADRTTVSNWLEARVPADLSIEPVTEPVSIHAHGLNFTRPYALWHLWKATGNVQYRDNYTELVTYQVEHPEFWSLDGAGYDVSHWVAQLGIRAISESYGGAGKASM